jgi:hypothetical protein
LGITRKRWAELMAMVRTAPDAMKGCMLPTASNISWICPEIRSVRALAAER